MSADLKKAGLKITGPRVKILQLLEESPQRHLSAEDVYQQLVDSGEDVGLATVYRVLTQFEASGLVLRHHFDEGHAVFELYDERHHDHMVCVDTGEVIEFIDPDIEKRQHEIVAALGYQLVDHDMVLYVRKMSSKDAQHESEHQPTLASLPKTRQVIRRFERNLVVPDVSQSLKAKSIKKRVKKKID